MRLFLRPSCRFAAPRGGSICYRICCPTPWSQVSLDPLAAARNEVRCVPHGGGLGESPLSVAQHACPCIRDTQPKLVGSAVGLAHSTDDVALSAVEAGGVFAGGDRPEKPKAVDSMARALYSPPNPAIEGAREPVQDARSRSASERACRRVLPRNRGAPPGREQPEHRSRSSVGFSVPRI